MQVEWYRDTSEARLMDKDTVMAVLPNVATRDDVDHMLHRIGSRRRTRWLKTKSGFAAKARRVE